jgi:ABC-type branched-subunit amino acid transport system ATPase component
MSVPTLQVRDVHAGYRPGIDILRGLTLETFADRPITVVVGPNGAGKSTLLKSIFGVLKPRSGSIALDGRPIAGESCHALKKGGVAYIAQSLNLFANLTVEDNLRVGAWTLRRDAGLVGERIEQAMEMFPILKQFAQRKAGDLSGGQARQLCIARELLTRPKLMLVDEPSVGVSPRIAGEIYEFLQECRRALGAAVILVDQRIEPAVAIADYVYVLNLGAVHASGDKSEFGSTRIREVIRQCIAG